MGYKRPDSLAVSGLQGVRIGILGCVLFSFSVVCLFLAYACLGPGSKSRCARNVGRSYLRSVLLGMTTLAAGYRGLRVFRFLDNVAARREEDGGVGMA